MSALIASSATAFTIVKYAGAAYLVLLGIRKLLARAAQEPDPEPRGPVTVRLLFGKGMVVNILNPKTALFFLAFLLSSSTRRRRSLRRCCWGCRGPGC